MENLFRYRACFEGNLLRFASACAHVRALMTLKSCAVGMRNAILRNYLKVAPYSFTIARAMMTKAQVICARPKENISVFRFFDVNMSAKSKIDSAFSRVSFGEIS